MDEFQLIHLNKHVCFALYTASHAYTQVYSEKLSEVGLSYEQYLVMMVLWQEQQQTLRGVADRLSLDMDTLLPALKSLENANLIERLPSNQDDGAMIITLTSQGNQIQYKTSQLQREMACETGLTDLELIELREKLDKLLENFKTRVQRTDEWLKNLPADL